LQLSTYTIALIFIILSLGVYELWLDTDEHAVKEQALGHIWV